MRRVMIVLGIVLIGLSGCSKSGGSGGNREKSIVGKWQQVETENEPQIIEFLKDERVLLYDLKDINKKEEVGLPGDYRFIDKKRIRMNVALFGPIDAEISPSGDEITLTNPFGKVEKYRKLENGDKPSVKNDREIQKRRLSRKETQLLGKYVGQMDNGSEISLEFKPDGTALVTSLIMAWEVIWSPRGNAPYTPTLTLMFYQLSGDSMGLSYHTSDGEKAIHIPLDFDSYQIDYWHRRVMDSQEILARQPGADLIKLDKREVKVWDEDERTICPGEVAIWNKYISKSGDQKTVLELKRISNFKPPGWKRLTGCDGLGSFYTIAEWEISGNKIKIGAGAENPVELEIEGKTLLDKKESITFVKQSDDSSFRIFPTKVTSPEKVVPEKKTSVLKIAFSRGVFQVGDFSVALSSIEREASKANLNFAITKIGKTSTEIEPLAITLTDDHQNNYYGTLEIVPYDDFPLHLLPTDFTYVKTASITMPKAAPIETIQLENTEKIAFKKLKLVKPQFKAGSGATFLLPGKPTLVGKYLLFTVDKIVPDLYTWALELTIENKEYNKLKGAVQSAVQFKDGRISLIGAPVIQEIGGLSKEKVRLSLEFLRSQEVSQPVTILVFYQDCSSGQTVLKLWPISEKNLPPRVGQGTDEKIFIEAYQRNSGRQALGDPRGLPHWLAGDIEPKDKFDVFVQEFPTSIIAWDKQNNASRAYLLHGTVLKKYQEPEIYRNLGPLTDDLKSGESNFGTKGVYGTFENGTVTSQAGQTLIVMGKIYKKWKEENFIRGPLGFPVSDEISVTSGAQRSDITGRVQRFEGGFICLITKGEKAGQVSEITGTIANAYSASGAETGWLGFPISEVYQSLGSKPADQMEFEAGYIGSRDGKKWEAFPYEAGQIVFASNRDGNKEIYVMDANGRNQVNLTNNPADDECPVWSPNGSRIVFESKRSGNSNIYIMDANGSNQKRLTHDLSGSPAWFPDGSTIAFSGIVANPYDKPLVGIYVVSTDGTGQRLIWQPTRGTEIKGYGIDPAVSPDGREIAFGVIDPLHGKTTQMWMMNSDGTGERRVNIGLYSPAGFYWSPLGNAVIFYLPNLWAKDLHEGKGIGVTDPRTGITAWVTNNFGKDPSFSPDGERIIFSHQGEIYIMDVTGSLGRKITKDTSGENTSPCWTAGKQKVMIKETPEELIVPTKEIPVKEIFEANIPGKYILEELDSTGKQLGREPGVMNFQEDGSIIGSYSGRWVVQDEQINFFEGSKKVGSGKLLAGAIANWRVDDVPAWQVEKIIKKEGAEMLKKGPEWIVVWSDYFSPENQSFGLKLRKDNTFSMSGLLEEKWKIENGTIQIYKGEKKTDFTDGRLEGSNIVFKLKDGLARLTRQN